MTWSSRFLTFTQENGLECSIRLSEIVGVTESVQRPSEAILLLSTTRCIGVKMTRQEVLDYIHLVESGSLPSEARAFVNAQVRHEP